MIGSVKRNTPAAKPITCLRLFRNRIGDGGAHAVAQLIKTTPVHEGTSPLFWGCDPWGRKRLSTRLSACLGCGRDESGEDPTVQAWDNAGHDLAKRQRF